MEMGATADASLEPMAMPTSAVARAAKSLMPSPQYMQVCPKPCMATGSLTASVTEACKACSIYISIL